jgi:hypothetical protein
MTGVADLRLIPVYKLNWNKSEMTVFIGSNQFYHSYDYDDTEFQSGTKWNYHLIPGIEVLYGYNMVNVACYSVSENRKKEFFDKPVLIQNVYYPSFSQDTIYGKPMKRDFFMVSVYDEDTNRDGFINTSDLRRLYLFDMMCEKRSSPIPENYSVFQTDYDPVNDLMIVYAQLCSNGDSKKNTGEPVHLFWVDMKNPRRTGRMY